jgi:hypothetical protein
MCVRLSGFKSYLGIASLAGALFGGSLSHAGALNGMDDPNRVSGKWIVVLRSEHIVSLRNPLLSDAHEMAAQSDKWKAAKEAAVSEVAQIVSKLVQAHPHVKISAVLSHGLTPGFVLKASDEDAKAIANEEDVKEVDADILVRNVTQP